MKPIYRVSFFKRLSDSTGHEIDACQGVVDVQAVSETAAVEMARLQFAELQGVKSWLQRADSEKVECLPLRKKLALKAAQMLHIGGGRAPSGSPVSRRVKSPPSSD